MAIELLIQPLNCRSIKLTPLSLSLGNLTTALLARAGHSSVVTSNDQVLVFGGYRFPTVVHREEGGGGSGSGEEGGGGEVLDGPQLLLYDMASGQWEEIEVNTSAPQPSPRYGHSSVIYNVSSAGH